MKHSGFSYTYARTIPTKPDGSDRIEVTMDFQFDDGDAVQHELRRVLLLLRQHIDQAEADLLGKSGNDANL